MGQGDENIIATGQPDDEIARSQDDLVIKKIEDIAEEVRSTQPLIDERKCVASLQAEYTNDGGFLSKIKELTVRYTDIRKVRGDGNCFYRALLYAECERLRSEPKEHAAFLKIAKEWKPRLFALGYPEMTTEDFCDVFTDFIESLPSLSAATLHSSLTDYMQSNYYIVFLRLVAAGYLQENAEFYGCFVDGERTLKDFCAQEVEPMDRTCDHLCIIALTKALCLSLRIEYLDRTQAPNGNWQHDFVEETPDAKPNVFLLYRHDHYDILYPTS